ncbi:flavin reductase [Streptomyces pseudovenezuelae]|uniref:flavin reductase n=1 Tax=Streptomyces pseudovenezuelae TaxID=67350 RepID=UPI003D7B2597
MVWLSKANRTYRAAERAERLAVHLLRHHQDRLARLFGGSTGDRTAKFTDVPWHRGPGEALIGEDGRGGGHAYVVLLAVRMVRRVHDGTGGHLRPMDGWPRLGQCGRPSRPGPRAARHRLRCAGALLLRLVLALLAAGEPENLA